MGKTFNSSSIKKALDTLTKEIRMHPLIKITSGLKETGSFLIKEVSFTTRTNIIGQYPKLAWVKKESTSPPKKPIYKLFLLSKLKLLAIRSTKTRLKGKNALCIKANSDKKSKNVFMLFTPPPQTPLQGPQYQKLVLL